MISGSGEDFLCIYFSTEKDARLYIYWMTLPDSDECEQIDFGTFYMPELLF